MCSPYRPKPEKTYVIRHKKHDAFTDAEVMATIFWLMGWLAWLPFHRTTF